MPADCWLVTTGTSWPTWIDAVSPLRAMHFRIRQDARLVVAGQRIQLRQDLAGAVAERQAEAARADAEPAERAGGDQVVAAVDARVGTFHSMPSAWLPPSRNSATTTSINADLTGRSSSRSSAWICWYSSALVPRMISVLVALLTTTRLLPLLEARVAGCGADGRLSPHRQRCRRAARGRAIRALRPASSRGPARRHI